MGQVVHISIDSVAGDHYGFASVEEQVLDAVLAQKDPDELSLLIIENTAGGYLVLPWSLLSRVSVRRDDATSWTVRWTRPERWTIPDNVIPTTLRSDML